MTSNMPLNSMGGATVLKVGDNFARSARNFFFWTPLTFWPVGGQNIAYYQPNSFV